MEKSRKNVKSECVEDVMGHHVVRNSSRSYNYLILKRYRRVTCDFSLGLNIRR